MSFDSLDDLINRFKGDTKTLYEYGDITFDLFNQFIQNQKEKFEEEVRNRLIYMKNQFKEEMEKSPFVDLLLNREREYFHAWIFEDSINGKLPKKLRDGHAIVTSDIRNEIKNFVKSKEPDYHLTIDLLKRQIDARVFIDYYKWLKDIHKYTFDDWLNDDIENFLKIPINEVSNGLFILVDELKLKKSEYEKIKKVSTRVF